MPGLSDPRVAIERAPASYPGAPPFSPPERYPEHAHLAGEPLDPTNLVYPAVRALLARLGLDRDRFGTAGWNPLGEIVRPGDRVLLKPNFILHQHLGGKDLFSVITHGSVIRAVIDYVHKALAGSGSILVADAPQANADWDRIVERTGLAATRAALGRRGVAFEFADLRVLKVAQRHGITVRRERTAAGAVIVDLGPASEMAALGSTLSNLCGSDYDRHRTVAGHRHGHRYAAARPVLECDVLVSLPKLKVHKKTGVSLNLKNMVGINADKNFIPHYRVGDARSGGDEFPVEPSAWGRLRDRAARLAIDVLLGRLDRVAAPLVSALVGAWAGAGEAAGALDAADAGYNQKVIRLFYRRVLGKPVRAGNWSGNDTLWRAILDLNRIALWAGPDGALHPEPARRYFSLVDGIVAGEGEGPMEPDPATAGVLLAGFSPLAVDLAATRLMGFDPARIPLLAGAAAAGERRLGPQQAPELLGDAALPLGRPFRPPSGWSELLAGAAAPGAAA